MPDSHSKIRKSIVTSTPLTPEAATHVDECDELNCEIQKPDGTSTPPVDKDKNWSASTTVAGFACRKCLSHIKSKKNLRRRLNRLKRRLQLLKNHKEVHVSMSFYQGTVFAVEDVWFWPACLPQQILEFVCPITLLLKWYN